MISVPLVYVIPLINILMEHHPHLMPWDLRQDPLLGAPAVGVLDRQPTKGSTQVDECGLAEIGNSKEETRDTQFRQVGPWGA
jgi:hypothetical protein